MATDQSKAPFAPPSTRSWRDIPQQVKPRAMSKEGRRRVWLRGFRLSGAACTLAASAWAGLQVVRVWRSDLRDVPGAEARAIGENLSLATDGVLDRAWLKERLALPARATLTDLDLPRLRARLLADGQVETAALIRQFPATLVVHLSERTPIVRLMAEAADGSRLPLLAARDGVVYQGRGYDPALIASLPWLDGVRLEPRPGGFAPLAGLAAAADLLARAKLEAEPLYRAWETISLARLATDDQIEVRMRGGVKAIFGAKDDFFGQLAKLDFILESAERSHPGQVLTGEIDLSLGAQVPVRLSVLTPPAAPAPPPSTLASQLRIQIPPTREF